MMADQIKEMAKHCPFYDKGECYIDAQFTSDCDLMCHMFGLMTNLENDGYIKPRKGKWLPQRLSSAGIVDCSECKTIGSPHWNWCPLCGADMRGDGKDNES